MPDVYLIKFEGVWTPPPPAGMLCCLLVPANYYRSGHNLPAALVVGAILIGTS